MGTATTMLPKFTRRMWQVLSSADRSGRVGAAYMRAASSLVQYGLLEIEQRLPDGSHAARLTATGAETLDHLRGASPQGQLLEQESDGIQAYDNAVGHLETHRTPRRSGVEAGNTLVQRGLIEMSDHPDAEGLYTARLTAAGIKALDWTRAQKEAGRSFLQVRTQGRM